MTPSNKKISQEPILDAACSGAEQDLVLKSTKQYVKPAVLTHSGEDILDELGPAQACYPFNSCGVVP